MKVLVEPSYRSGLGSQNSQNCTFCNQKLSPKHIPELPNLKSSKFTSVIAKSVHQRLVSTYLF